MRFLFLVTLAVPGASFAIVVMGIVAASSVPDRRRTHGLLHLAGTPHFDGTNATLLAACPAFGFAGLAAASPPLPRTVARTRGRPYRTRLEQRWPAEVSGTGQPPTAPRLLTA
ncbi:hypothetical protein ABZT04_38300 [Streptomyces sp. NPDC005492]|uniref:hypothetical protein n=1 Tax=Streptomyces sp. NPDC005492 TaxID=3156883 RepID=UPI0033B87746